MHLYLYHRGFPRQDSAIHQGVAKAVAGLAGGLVANGASVTVLCENERASEVVSNEGYRILCFERKDTTDPHDRLRFSLAPGLRSYIARSKTAIDLVIVNGMFYRPLTQMSALLNKHAIPYIVAPHDPFHPYLFEKKRLRKRAYWYLFEKRMLKRARAIQVLDERHTKWLRRRGINRPTIVTPNGFNADNVPKLETLSWSQTDEVKLIFLGRIDIHNKGLDLLLEALTKVSLPPNLSLTVQGPDQGGVASLNDLAERLGLCGKVHIKNPDYSQSSTQLIGEHDIFCLPSRFEGFGLAALEAMLAGRVLLVSDIAGITPHVETSGCGVSVQPTPESIGAGLRTLLTRRDDWKTMGLQGRRYALNVLDWKKIAAKALPQFERFATEKRKIR